MLYISDAFSFRMLSKPAATLWFRTLSMEEAKDLVDFHRKRASCVGHQGLARVLSNMLGVQIQASTEGITLNKWDELMVADYSGPPLRKGARNLPEEAKITFYEVGVINYYPPQRAL